jgi:hypothetical protein
VGQVQELRHTGVVGAQHRGEHVRLHGRTVDLDEPVPGEELLLEREHEQSLQTQLACAVDERADDGVPHTAPEDARVHRDGADLAEVLPEHVQRAAADHLAVELRYQELRHGLVERDHLLGEQHPPCVGVHELFDLPDVGGACPPHEWCRHEPSA